jgi:hypothetical protein
MAALINAAQSATVRVGRCGPSVVVDSAGGGERNLVDDDPKRVRVASSDGGTLFKQFGEWVRQTGQWPPQFGRDVA